MSKKPDGMPTKKSHTARRLLGYVMRGYKFRFFLVLVCILVSAIATVAGSMFLEPLVDDYIVPLVSMANPDFSGLLTALIQLGVLYLVGLICSFLFNRIMVTISQGVQKQIRDELFSHMQSLPIKYFDTHAHGDVYERIHQRRGHSAPDVLPEHPSDVQLPGDDHCGLCGHAHAQCGAHRVVILCVLCMLVVTRYVAGRSAKHFIRQQVKLGDLNGYIEEMVNGQKVVKVFCHEEKAQEALTR